MGSSTSFLLEQLKSNSPNKLGLSILNTEIELHIFQTNVTSIKSQKVNCIRNTWVENTRINMGKPQEKYSKKTEGGGGTGLLHCKLHVYQETLSKKVHSNCSWQPASVHRLFTRCKHSTKPPPGQEQANFTQETTNPPLSYQTRQEHTTGANCFRTFHYNDETEDDLGNRRIHC